MRLRDTKGQALTAEPIARGDTTDANVPAAQNFLPDQCDGRARREADRQVAGSDGRLKPLAPFTDSFL